MTEAAKEVMYRGGGSTPVPDPTALTAAAVATAEEMLRREIRSAVELLRAENAGQREVLAVRLEGMDRAVELLKAENDKSLLKLAASVEIETAHLLELANEKANTVNVLFAGVQREFELRDQRAEQTTKDTKVAVDAALQAAEKAVSKQNENFSLLINKSEASITKTIDQLLTVIGTTSTNTASQITDLKDRQTRIESLATGSALLKQDQRTGGGYLVSIAGFVLALIMGIISVVVLLRP